VQSSSRIGKPASEAIFRPALVPEKNGTGALNEQGTKVSTLTIDSETTADERAEAMKGFVDDLRSMSGERIVAIAIASDS
jgi:hypothetical protein